MFRRSSSDVIPAPILEPKNLFMFSEAWDVDSSKYSLLFKQINQVASKARFGFPEKHFFHSYTCIEAHLNKVGMLYIHVFFDSYPFFVKCFAAQSHVVLNFKVSKR